MKNSQNVKSIRIKNRMAKISKRVRKRIYKRKVETVDRTGLTEIEKITAILAFTFL